MVMTYEGWIGRGSFQSDSAYMHWLQSKANEMVCGDTGLRVRDNDGRLVTPAAALTELKQELEKDKIEKNKHNGYKYC